MNIDFEPVMDALFANLVAAASGAFTATATEGSAVLTDVSSWDCLFAGLPVFGPGVASGVTIASLDAGAGTVTLSDLLSAAGADVGFTTGFLTTGRRVLPWSQVSDQPAMFLRRTGTEDIGDDPFTITTLLCEVWIYSQAGQDPDAIPDVALSNLDRMLRASFAPDTHDGRYTLGGLAYWCRIEGRSDYSAGDLSSQGLSRIPVKITLP